MRHYFVLITWYGTDYMVWYVHSVHLYTTGIFTEEFGNYDTVEGTQKNSILAIREELDIIEDEDIEIVHSDKNNTSE